MHSSLALLLFLFDPHTRIKSFSQDRFAFYSLSEPFFLLAYGVSYPSPHICPKLPVSSLVPVLDLGPFFMKL